jgi:hypothetical protein
LTKNAHSQRNKKVTELSSPLITLVDLGLSLFVCPDVDVCLILMFLEELLTHLESCYGAQHKRLTRGKSGKNAPFDRCAERGGGDSGREGGREGGMEAAIEPDTCRRSDAFTGFPATHIVV